MALALKAEPFRNGVIRAILTVRRSLPVYPEKQTFSEPVGMSQRCHHRKSVDFDHFVGAFFLAKASRLYKQEAREMLV